MNEQELTNAGMNDDDVMLSDGWTEGADFFNPDSWGGTSNADGQETPEQDNGADSGTNAGESAPEPVPTTDGEGQAETSGDVPPDGGNTDESAPDAARGESVGTPRVFKLKVNHEAREVDVNAMSDEELTAIFQKATAFDEGKKQAKYQAAYDKAMTDSGYRMPSEADAVESTDSAGPAAQTAPEANPYADALKAAEERAKAAEARAAQLEKDKNILLQNQKAAAKAPVKGVTGGGVSSKGASSIDMMLEAFRKDTW